MSDISPDRTESEVLMLAAGVERASDLGVKVTPTLKEALKRADQRGKSAVVVMDDGRAVAVLAPADKTRDTAADMIDRLRELGSVLTTTEDNLDRLLVLPLAKVQELAGTPGAVSGFWVRLAPGTDLNPVITVIIQITPSAEVAVLMEHEAG